MVLASLFVAMAVLGGKPTAINAGKEMSPPPPTIAFKKDAIKASSNNIVSESKSISINMLPSFLIAF